MQALFCQVPVSHVLNLSDVSNIWHVPLMMEAQEAHRSICSHLSLEGAGGLNLTTWRTTLAERWDRLQQACHIAMVGKYTGLSDAYLSVIKALQVIGLFDFVSSRGFFSHWDVAMHLLSENGIP